MTEQAELNLKYGPLFADQPKRTKSKKKLRNNQTETQNEQKKNQSQTNRIFENAYNVNKTEQSETTTTGQSNISTPKSSRKSTIENNEYRIKKVSTTGEQPVKIWNLSDPETIVRNREGWWSKEMHYSDWAH